MILEFFFWHLFLLITNVAVTKPKNLKGIVEKTRIIHGRRTNINENSFLVTLHQDLYRTNNYALHGAGCIISSNWVLSAAHLFYDTDKLITETPLELMIIVSEMKEVYEEGSVHDLLKVIKDDRFNPHRLYDGYDIALIKVSEPFASLSTKRLTLAGSGYPYKIGTRLRILGFGLVDPKGTMNNYTGSLHEAHITLSPAKSCLYPVSKNNNFMQFCAGENITIPKETDISSVDACAGDSGGPILDSKGVAIGIVSSGIGRGEDMCGWYGWYEKIGYHEEWIRNHVGKIDGEKGVTEIKFTNET